MGKGSTIRPFNRFKFGKNYDRIFNKQVRKGMKAKATQVHKNKKKEQNIWNKKTKIQLKTLKIRSKIYRKKTTCINKKIKQTNKSSKKLNKM